MLNSLEYHFPDISWGSTPILELVDNLKIALKKETSMLPKDPTLPVMSAQARKDHPIARGVLDYFPDALMEVAHLSKVGNDQHNPGQPMHWAKEKSTDEADALLRHLIDRGTIDTDGIRHSTKVAWRALALLQREIEAERNGPQQAAPHYEYNELEGVAYSNGDTFHYPGMNND